MTPRRRLVAPTVPALLLAFVVGATAQATDPALDQAKSLYASASFEDALAAIARVDPTLAAAPEVLLYKALCLLALGRPLDASTATRTLVTTAPLYAPEATDLPPRFQTLWNDTRKSVLPGVAREYFAGARTRYQSKDFEAAATQFEQVVTLTNDPAWKDTSEALDLRTLASGFVELAEASIPKPEPVPAPAAEVPPVPAPAAPPPPAPVPIVVEPATVIRQEMPRWSPPDRMLARMNFDGAVRVQIDETGRVTSAEIVRSAHPSYDAQLLRAARGWTYRPATRNGQPIASERVVEVHLAASQE